MHGLSLQRCGMAIYILSLHVCTHTELSFGSSLAGAEEHVRHVHFLNEDTQGAVKK